MKKIIFFIFICSLFTSCFTLEGNSTTHRTNNLKEQSFVYEILTSTIDTTIRRDHYSINTFQINGNQFSTDNSVRLTVNNYTSDFINYTLSCSDYETQESFPFNDSLTYLFVYINYYKYSAFSMASWIAFDVSNQNDFNNTYYSKGLELEILYFLPPTENLWDYFEELSLFFNNQSNINTEIITDGTIQCQYNETDEMVQFESWVYGSTKNADYNGDFNCGLITVYNKTSGVLNGLRTIGSYTGKINGIKIDYFHELHLELSNYNLPELSIYSEIASLPGIFFTTLSFLIIIPILTRRKKK